MISHVTEDRATNQDSKPLCPDVAVIALIRDRWGRSWQSRHHVLSRLARYFHVVWCNPPRGWRESMLGGPYPSPDQSGIPGLELHSPGMMESEIYRPSVLKSFTEYNRYQAALAKARRIGAKKIILYLWRPEFLSALRSMAHDVSVYHIDDEYSFSTNETGIDPEERALMERVDEVFIHSPGLMEKKGSINPNTARIPNGVDFRAFNTAQAEPDDLATIPHPRIGYVGYMKSQLNFKLMNDLARLRSDWSFVLVGPLGVLKDQKAPFDAMLKLPNVHHLGERPKDSIPGYVQHMDVCSMCYNIDDYTKYIYPLKIHEYFGAGKPVVATPIRSLLEFDGLLELAETVDDWVAAIDRILGRQSADVTRLAERRQHLAERYDWERITGTIAEHFCRLLGDDYVERLVNAENPNISNSET